MNSNSKVFNFKAMQSALADFKSLLHDESMADVVFVVGNEKIRAHRQIVGARCEVLKTMLYGTFAEGKEIDVGHETNPEMFKKVLEFIYGGVVQIDDKNALPLMELAHKYSITNLEEACSSFLGKTLDVENVLPVYAIALSLTRKDLSDVCINFIRSRAKEVFSAPSFLDVSEELLCSILSDDELAMDELDLFESAVKWGKHRADSNNEALESIMSSVVQVIRFPLISASKLINKVKTTGVVPIELYVEALEFSASPRTVPMDGSRFKKRKAPKILATILTSTNTEEPSPRSRPATNTPTVSLEQSTDLDSSIDSSKRTPSSFNTKKVTTVVTPKQKHEDLDEDSKLDKNGGTQNGTQEEKPQIIEIIQKETPQKENKLDSSTTPSVTPTSAQQNASGQKKNKKAPSTPNSAPVIPSGTHELKYEKDFDENGVFYWIGTNGKTTDWENPANNGKVLLTSSTHFDWGQSANLVSRKVYNTWTGSQPGVWVSFSLRGLGVLPSFYSLRHGYVSDGANLRNWVLEGSTDGHTWNVLSTHQNDRTLGGNYGTGSWKIENAREFYQHFRIRSTGRDGGASDRIQLSGFELYGHLLEK